MQLELIPNIEISREPGSIADRFARFHEVNPHVYRNLVQLARMKRIGRPTRKLSIDLLYAILRDKYDEAHVLPDGEEYYLNNDFRSRYSRLIMEKEPDLQGAFEIRRLRERA
jgi:hypothetical protein